MTQWPNSQFWSAVCGIFSIRTFWCVMRYVLYTCDPINSCRAMQDCCIAMTPLPLSEMWIQEHFWRPKSVHVPSQHLCTKHKSQMGSLSVFSGCQHPCALVGYQFEWSVRICLSIQSQPMDLSVSLTATPDFPFFMSERHWHNLPSQSCMYPVRQVVLIKYRTSQLSI